MKANNRTKNNNEVMKTLAHEKHPVEYSKRRAIHFLPNNQLFSEKKTITLKRLPNYLAL